MIKYVRCTKTDCEGLTEGKIYKVKTWIMGIPIVIDDDGDEHGFIDSQYEPAKEQDFFSQELWKGATDWTSTLKVARHLASLTCGQFTIQVEEQDDYDLADIMEQSFFGLKTYDNNQPQFDRVIFSDPATIVFWKDGTKTVAKCQKGDTFSHEIGLAVCYFKKSFPTQRDKEYIKRVIKRAVTK